ncbi:hypothetical protein SDC9_212497 [bioreactor metagenome]|uniref:Uncharacterized protein n=1 Tax=bioreactor metagenome TaxID=1076179 RepID=A0A645JM71_9ZZZZ
MVKLLLIMVAMIVTVNKDTIVICVWYWIIMNNRKKFQKLNWQYEDIVNGEMNLITKIYLNVPKH